MVHLKILCFNSQIISNSIHHKSASDFCHRTFHQMSSCCAASAARRLGTQLFQAFRRSLKFWFTYCIFKKNGASSFKKKIQTFFGGRLLHPSTSYGFFSERNTTAFDCNCGAVHASLSVLSLEDRRGGPSPEGWAEWPVVQTF